MPENRPINRSVLWIKLLILGVAYALPPGGMATAPEPAEIASVTAPNQESLVEQTWHQNGLQLLCDSMVSNILNSVRQHPDLSGAPAHRRNRLLAAYRKHATAHRFERRMKKYLSNTPRPALLAMNRLSGSAIGQRAMQEERRFAAVDPATLLSYWRQLRRQPDSGPRIAAIRRLDQALGVTDIALSVAGASLYGARTALGGESRANQAKQPTQDLSLMVDAFVKKMRPAQQQQVEITYLYLYRNLSLVELNDYVSRYEQEPVRGLQRRLVQALGTEMIAIQGDVIRELTGPVPASTGTDI